MIPNSTPDPRRHQEGYHCDGCKSFSNSYFGISFQYPENWTLDEEDALAGNKSVTVYSPGGAFWSVSIHPREADPRQLADDAIEAMKGVYEGLESEITQETIAGRELVGGNLYFFCLDLTNTAIVRCLRTNQASYVLFWQAEDREFDKLDPVFRAMAVSLLSHLKSLNYWE